MYTLFVVVMAWVLFRADDFTYAWGYYKAMFSYKSIQLNRDILDVFLNDQVYAMFLLAVVSSTHLWVIVYKRGKRFLPRLNELQYNLIQVCWTILVLLFIGGTLLLSTISLIANTYNPFIYFRF